jgi:hypothetical protein
MSVNVPQSTRNVGALTEKSMNNLMTKSTEKLKAKGFMGMMMDDANEEAENRRLTERFISSSNLDSGSGLRSP